MYKIESAQYRCASDISTAVVVAVISQTLEGKTWTRQVVVSGTDAQNLWDSWSQGNEAQIITTFLAI